MPARLARRPSLASPPSWRAARLVWAVASGAVSAACADPAPVLDDASLPATDASGRADAAGACTPSFGAVVERPALADARLTEVSGIVSSRRDPGVHYVHNDSGEPAARFFAVRDDGTTLAEIVIDGAPPPRDWEDVAIETGPGGVEILSFGDVGDNAARTGTGAPRASVSIVRVEPPPLPDTPSASPLHATLRSTLELSYPDGPHDCEAIFVDPDTGDLYLVTKVDAGPSGVYRAAAPLDGGGTRTLEHVVDILPRDPSITAADADARFVVLRSYTRGWLYVRGGRPLAEVLAGVPNRLPMVSEPQGEAVALTEDGRGVLFASEGAAQALHFVSVECP